MPLGIRLVVDFAFKCVFGSPRNSDALIGLLNAILDLADPIVEVQILNPFNHQEFEDSKQIVLDVRCQDSYGRQLNVEMQMGSHPGLIQRLVYYVCSMYVDQVSGGESYSEARPAISICLLEGMMFRDSVQAHHRFRLTDRDSGREIANAVEVHTIELPKYNLSSETIRNAGEIEKWVFLIRHAQDYSAEDLRRLLPGRAFEAAIETLQMISEKSEDKRMYDEREKARRDHEWVLADMRRAALKEGREEGLEEGLEQGQQQGMEMGREQGELLGKIDLLESLLGDSPTPRELLLALDVEKLRDRAQELQARLRDRQ